MVNPFYARDIVTIKDFGLSELEHLFDTVDKMDKLPAEEKRRLAAGKIIAMMFYEPSTRTRLSFEAAMASIGGSSIGFSEPKSTSVVKGENLADSVRVVEGYADIIVLRHSMEGAAKFAAEIAEKPVINAGSGSEEHPTQAMLDLYTIRREKGSIHGLRIAIIGDLKYGRTVYSLLYGLASYKPRVYLTSPPLLKIRKEAIYDLGDKITIHEKENLEEIIGEIDVLYVTRIQKERFPDPHEYERAKGSYVVDAKLLDKAKKDLIILHPLPRIDEISPEVDKTPHAKYFAQSRFGKSLRAGLITLILNENFALH